MDFLDLIPYSSYFSDSLIKRLIHALFHEPIVDNKQVKTIILQCQDQNINLNDIKINHASLVSSFIMQKELFSTTRLLLSYVNLKSLETWQISRKHNIFFYLLCPFEEMSPYKIKILVYLLRVCFPENNNATLSQLLNQLCSCKRTPMTLFLLDNHILKLPKAISFKLLTHTDLCNHTKTNESMISWFYKRPLKYYMQIRRENEVIQRFLLLAPSQQVFMLFLITMKKHPYLISRLQSNFKTVFKNLYWTYNGIRFLYYTAWMPSEVLDDIFTFIY